MRELKIPPVSPGGKTNIIARLMGDRLDEINDEFRDRVKNHLSDVLTAEITVKIVASMDLTPEEYLGLTMLTTLTLADLGEFG